MHATGPATLTPRRPRWPVTVAVLALAILYTIALGAGTWWSPPYLLQWTLVTLAITTIGAAIGAMHRTIRAMHHQLHETAPTPPPPAPPQPEPTPRIEEPPTDIQIGLIANRAQRLQPTVHAALNHLDRIERRTENPQVLAVLFEVDHALTILRRQIETLVALGGQSPRRRWTQPVSLYDVVRAAASEIAQYRRVRIIRPVPGTVQGRAVVDVVHILAELLDNATKFSKPDTAVTVTVTAVTAGIAIEIEDRGTGIGDHQARAYSQLLVNPDIAPLKDLIAEGRISIYVIAHIARRYGLRMRLTPNIFGGTTAAVVLPADILGGGTHTRTPAQRTPTPRSGTNTGNPAREVVPDTRRTRD